MTIDKKNKIIIDYMRQCPQIDHMYAVFAKIEDGTFSFEPQTNDTLVTYWIDGRAYKRIVYTISCYNTYTTNPISSNEYIEHKNLLEIEDMQNIINWFKRQVKERNFPDFGQYIQIEEMYSMTDEPILIGVNDEMSPPIAKYELQFAIEYVEDEDGEYNSEIISI